MGVRQRVTILAVVLVAVAGMVTPAIAAPIVQQPGPDPIEPTAEPLTDAAVVDDAGNDTATNETANQTAPLGSQISAFMQSSSVAANESVENGLWEARFEANGTNKSAMIDRRTVVLETRLERLRAELEALNTSETPGLADVSHAGRVASLTARISALESTLNQTSTIAAEAGVNHTRLDRLRENASSLNGRAVSEIARGLTVVENPGRGPPEDHGPPDDRGPRNDSGPGNGQGPPSERGGNETGSESPNGDGPGNGQGPPSERGGNETGSESPNGDGPGNGRGPPTADNESDRDRDTSNSGSGQPDDEAGAEGDEQPGQPETAARPITDLVTRWTQ